MVGLDIEMFDFLVQSQSKSYEVIFRQAYPPFGPLEEYFFLVDDFFKDRLNLEAKAIYISAKESSKSLQTCDYILQELARSGANRGSTLQVIGGGLIQDIGTLVSSLYMRGISWTFTPTTLMAMMDSCIGGKSSINCGNFKNLVGNFYPPSKIIINTHFLQTLGRLEMACGFLEGIKICFARGEESYKSFCNLMSASLVEGIYLDSNLQSLIHTVLFAKKWFIEVDEYDTKERQLLNFGHTFAHALEIASDFKIPHGLAVGYGILAALAYDSSPLSALEEDLRHRVTELISYALSGLNLEVKFDEESFLNAFIADKKHTKNNYFLILSRDGELYKSPLPKNESTRRSVLNALKYSIESVKC